MASLTVKKVLDVSLNKAWEIIRDFSHVNQWVDDVKQIVMTDTNGNPIRNLTLKDDSLVSEQLIKLDDVHHIISYKSLATQLPFKNYVAIIEVKEINNTSCEVIWTSNYIPEGIEEQTANQLLKTNYLRYLNQVATLANNLK